MNEGGYLEVSFMVHTHMDFPGGMKVCERCIYLSSVLLVFDCVEL